MLKSAETERGGIASASVDIGMPPMTSLHGLIYPVAEAVGFWCGLRCHIVFWFGLWFSRVGCAPPPLGWIKELASLYSPERLLSALL
jgi:hypothetical protein